MCYLQLSVPVSLKWIIRKKFECRMHFDLHYLSQLLILENVLFSSLRLLAPSMCCVSALPSMVAGEKAVVNLGSILEYDGSFISPLLDSRLSFDSLCLVWKSLNLF